MEISFKEMMCFVAVVDYLRNQGVPLESYRFILKEENDFYSIAAFDEARPFGFKGSRQGFPQPTLKIDKKTLAVVKVTLTR